MISSHRLSETHRPSETLLSTAGAARVLVVEDDNEMRGYVASTLAGLSYNVEQAGDGLAALAAIRERTPDLVICDLNMPRMGGLKLLEQLRNDTARRNLPFILLSGVTDVDTKVACIESGANDYLAKPIDAAELAVRVRQQLDLARQLEQLRERCYIDELTGILNRRGAIEALERELTRCRRHSSSLGLLLLDLDKFKHINDSYGHATGDDVLREVAAVLSAAVRSSDVVGRLGGDEFIVVLPDVDAEGASAIVDRIREQVAAVQVNGKTGEVNVSIGCFFDRTGATIELLLDATDRQMYSDKRRRCRPLLKVL